MRIQLPSGTPALRATPPGDPTRGVVLIPDIGGLRPLFEDLCDGWVVVAPEPWAGREHLALDERLALVGTISDDAMLADCRAAADATGVEPVAVIGFCMGGMFALKAASTGRFDRAVSFYGMIRVPEQWRSAGQAEPLELLTQDGDQPAAQVLALCGTADTWLPVADVDALEATGATVVRYEGAEHGFVHDPDRPAHRPAEAADAWRRVARFLT
jgi:carboxymethylenebutenolidase